jgi:RNA polymerase sigma-70 factor (ECF subfamily)
LESRRRTFEKLSQQRLERAYRLATALLRDEQAAQDAVHDAVVHAWVRWPDLRDQERFDAWFDRIVVNCCRSSMRRSQTSSRLLLTPATEVRVDSDYGARETGALRLALEALPVEQRMVIVLRFVEDLSIRQIAELTHMR